MNTRIIGLVGRARSGKDTVFQMLRDAGVDARRVAFADALKCEVFDGIHHGFMPVKMLMRESNCLVQTPPWADHCSGEQKIAWIDQHKDALRYTLQCYGTEYARRFYGDEYWITRVARAIDHLRGTCSAIVVTDGRFQNEADFIHRLGGAVVRIDRWPGWWEWLKRKFWPEHATERVEHITVDRVIKNNGTLEDLRRQAVMLFSMGLTERKSADDQQFTP